MKKRISGKVIGGLLGFAFAGPLGAVMGLAVGHAHDNRGAETNDFWSSLRTSYGGFSGNMQQAAFTMGVIVLGAKMAKADGRVTREAIEAFKRVFQVPEAQVLSVGRLFDQAGRTAEGFEPYAYQLAQIFHGRPAVLEEVLGGLFIIAAADSGNVLSANELKFLERVGTIFQFNVQDFVRIAARSGVRLSLREKQKDESYAILGIKEEATAEQIKQAYRALIRKHHPDKLVAQGMPPEFIATANEKMKRINVAYETICRARGIN